MDWREYIHADPEILVGKPVVKGTRLSVEFILGLFAAGWTEDEVLANYPTLTQESLRAVFTSEELNIKEDATLEVESRDGGIFLRPALNSSRGRMGIYTGTPRVR